MNFSALYAGIIIEKKIEFNAKHSTKKLSLRKKENKILKN